MNLYWCETEDHDEDWFVVASSAREAARFHAVAEGYRQREVRVILVCHIPATLTPQMQGWPDHDLLGALGGMFVSESTPRTGQFQGRVYAEGGFDAVLRRLEDDQAEAMGKGRPNGTTRLM